MIEETTIDSAQEPILSKSKANLQCIPPKGNDTSLFFKGGRREITINSGKAVIRTNGNEYDAAAILKSFERSKVDIRGITGIQWEKMLKGQGTVLDPERPGTLFSIQKQSCGYGIRVVSVDLQSAKGVQNEI